MRSLRFAFVAFIPAMLVAQEVPPPGVGVDRIALAPGETKAFTLAPGHDHQLLLPTDPARPAPKAIVVHYSADASGSTIRVESKLGYPTGFSVLADPDGDGGFAPAGDVVDVPGDGRSVSRTWPMPLGRINVGGFTGPHGDHEHAPAGE